MKKKLAIFGLILSLLCFAACSTGGSGDDNTNTGETGTVTLNTAELVLEEGEKAALTAQADPAGDIVWSSDNEAAATVSDAGEVTAVKAGYAIITAKCGGAAAYCEVTVSAPAEPAVVTETIYEANFKEMDEVPADLNAETQGDGAFTITDEGLRVSISSSGSSAFAYKQLEGTEGRISVEMRIKADASAFANAMFLYRGTEGKDPTQDGILSFSMSGGNFQNNSGGWASIGARYTTRAWYDVRLVFDTGAGMYDAYINGLKYASIPFRNAGEGFEDSIDLMVFGSESNGADFTYEYIRVTKVTSAYAPAVYANQTSYSVVLEQAKEVVLDYSVTGNPAPEISVTASTGASVADDNKTVSVSAAGSYTVTVTATNAAGSASKTFTVNARAQSAVYLDTDFSSASAAGVTTTGSGGTVSFGADGATVKATSTSGIWIDKKFDAAFDGIVVFEISFKENVDNAASAFTNLLFLYNSNASGDLGSTATGVAVRNADNELCWSEQSSGGWTAFQDANGNRVLLNVGTTYTLKVVHDFDNKMSYFYLTGEGANNTFSETYLGSHTFRNSSVENIDRIRIGSDKTGTDFTVSHLTVYQGDSSDIRTA